MNQQFPAWVLALRNVGVIDFSWSGYAQLVIAAIGWMWATTVIARLALFYHWRAKVIRGAQIIADGKQRPVITRWITLVRYINVARTVGIGAIAASLAMSWMCGSTFGEGMSRASALLLHTLMAFTVIVLISVIRGIRADSGKSQKRQSTNQTALS